MRQCGAIASNNSVQAALRNQTNTSREVSCSYTHYIRRKILGLLPKQHSTQLLQRRYARRYVEQCVIVIVMIL